MRTSEEVLIHFLKWCIENECYDKWLEEQALQSPAALTPGLLHATSLISGVITWDEATLGFSYWEHLHYLWREECNNHGLEGFVI